MCTILYFFVVDKDSRERWRDRKRGERERKRVLSFPRDEFLSDYTLLSAWVNSEIKYTETTVNRLRRLYLSLYTSTYNNNNQIKR